LPVDLGLPSTSSDEYFDFNYLTSQNTFILQGFDQFSGFTESGEVFERHQSIEDSIKVTQLLNRIFRNKKDSFKSFFQPTQYGYPIWDRAVVVNNTTDGFNLVKIPFAIIESDVITGILYCKIVGNTFINASYLVTLNFFRS